VRNSAAPWIGLVAIPLCAWLGGCGGGDDDDSNAGNTTGGTVSTGTGGATSGTGGAGITSTGGTTTAGGGSKTGGSGPTGTGGAAPDSPGAGLPNDAVLSHLTPAQATQLCEQSIAYSRGPACLAAGWMAAVLSVGADAEAACQSMNDECLAASTTGDCATASQDLEDCSATVAEYDQCSVDSIEAIADALGGTTCATIDMAAQPSSEDPASCQTLETKCPGAVTGTGG
jgi:hypothetical protein